MGTRNLTTVYVDGVLRVRQYGQWDGYPTSMGEEVLNLCANRYSMDRLVDALGDDRMVTLLDPGEEDALDRLNRMMMDCEDREVRKVYFEHVLRQSPLHRDCGWSVLAYLAHGPGIAKLMDWGGDMDWIEGTARVDIETREGGYDFRVTLTYHGEERVYDGADVRGMTPEAIREEMRRFEDEVRVKEGRG